MKDFQTLSVEEKQTIEEEIQRRTDQVERDNANLQWQEIMEEKQKTNPAENVTETDQSESMIVETTNPSKEEEEEERQKMEVEQKKRDEANEAWLKANSEVKKKETQPSIAKPSSSLNVPVKWAQRKDQIYIAFGIQDAKDTQISLQSSKLTFVGVSGGKTYFTELEFYGEIDTEKSKYVVKPRAIEFVLIRKETGPYWPRLTKEKLKVNWLTIDWDRWVDEDESDNEGFDMGGMGGLGGMDGMDFGEEESDEEAPSLEKSEDQKEKSENKTEKSETSTKGEQISEEEMPPLE